MEIGLLLLRLAVGLAMASHGAQKLFGWFGGAGPAGTGAFMQKLGFRNGEQMATAAGLLELVGGLLLALGFFTAFGAAMVITVLAVATGAVHIDKGFFNSGGGFELPFAFAAAALALAFTGPGSISLDAALGIGTYGPVWGLLALAAGLLTGVAVLSTRRRAEAAA